MTTSEKVVMKSLLSDGWIVVKNGYPDFFCFHPKFKEKKFVEVKSGQLGLSLSQKKTIKYLRKSGLLVDVLHVDANKNITPFKQRRVHPAIITEMKRRAKIGWEKQKKKILERAKKVGIKVKVE